MIKYILIGLTILFLIILYRFIKDIDESLKDMDDVS
jgi:hypothetical protein